MKSAVIVMWMTSMTWLVTKKVLPPLLKGEPPNYRRIVEARRDAPPVAWRLSLGARRVGWALSSSHSLPSGLTEFSSRVHFENLTLDSLTPAWAKALLRSSEKSMRELDVDAESKAVVDLFGQLMQFQSVVGVGGVAQLVRLDGTVDDRRMDLHVRTGDFSYEQEFYLPKNTMMGDVFSPQSELPGLRVGQTWRVPVYNPLRPHPPVEILSAEVEHTELLEWGGTNIQCFVVTYNRDRGYGPHRSKTVRGRLWVREDGAVLRQEANLFETEMAFTRLTPRETSELVARVEHTSLLSSPERR
ncbi:MAG: hypothetical protein ACOY3P_12715 [Planctomycetota bacterium]